MEFLIYLEGGPLNGKVFSTKTLFGAPSKMDGIDDYEPTTRRITSPVTGKSAQVWQFKVN